MAGLIGLDYGAIIAVATLHEVEDKRQLLTELQWIESAILSELAEQAFTINMNNGFEIQHNKSQTNRHTRAMRRFLLPVTPPRVIETGLAMVEMTEGSFTSTTNTIDYVSYD